MNLFTRKYGIASNNGRNIQIRNSQQTNGNSLERNNLHSKPTRISLEKTEANPITRYRRQGSNLSRNEENNNTTTDHYLNLEINTILKNMDKIAVQSAYPKEIEVKEGGSGTDSSGRENTEC